MGCFGVKLLSDFGDVNLVCCDGEVVGGIVDFESDFD